ncbi:MAG: hypothetical protein KAT65_18890 [Methanophagales archaeon]|jgi:hypothetical protein|nr:hypothetical protein [Methanophagales archaeon]
MTWCNEAAIVEVSETPWEYGTDKHTGITGIKSDDGYNDNESRTVWFNLLDDWPESDMVYVCTKAGQNVNCSNVTGPVCAPCKPDLVVEKSVTIEDGNFTVSYTVKNLGCGTAGESRVCKYLNGTLTEKKKLFQHWVLVRATAAHLILSYAHAARP